MRVEDVSDFNPFEMPLFTTGFFQFGVVLACVVLGPAGLFGLWAFANGMPAGGLVALGSFGYIAFAWVWTAGRTKNERRWHDDFRRHWNASSDSVWARYLSGLTELQCDTGARVLLVRCRDELRVFNERRKVLVVPVQEIEAIGVGSETTSYSEYDAGLDLYVNREGVATNLLELALTGHRLKTVFRMSGTDDVHRWLDILGR